MKVKFFAYICVLFVVLGCEKKESNQFGQVIFYTNAQAMINCGPFDVNIFIEGKKVGQLGNPVDEGFVPNCSASQLTLQIKRAPGHYNCKAIGCNSYECQKEFDIYVDSCTYVFLDIHDFHQPE